MFGSILHISSQPTPDDEPTGEATQPDLSDLSEDQLLDRMNQALDTRRAAEVNELEVAVAWAYAHGHPRRDREPMSEPGGEGSPPIRQYAIGEIALVRGTHALTARSLIGDALDLVHRLPLVWDVVHTGRCESWVARRVAFLTRHLPLDVIGVVDAAVAEALVGGEAASTVFEITAAKTIEADPQLHEQRLQQELNNRTSPGYVSLSQSDEHGYRRIIASVQSGDAAMLDALINRIADILETQQPAAVEADDDIDNAYTRQAARDHLRAEAMGWLTRPADLLKLLLDHTHADDAVPTPAEPPEHHTSVEPVETPVPDEAPEDEDAWPADEPDRTSVDPEHAAVEPVETTEPDHSLVEPVETRPAWLPEHTNLTLERLAALSVRQLASLRGSTTLFVHTTAAAIEDQHGLARLEGGGAGGGPHWITHLAALLGHSNLTVKPVIDLNNRPAPTTAYEHSEALKDQVWLTAGGDVFPYSTKRNTRGTVEFDHTVPFDPGPPDGPAPPGQTGVHNSGPLTRRHHRWKTHAGYTVTLLPSPAGPRYLWTTPTGRTYLRDHHGTRAIPRDLAKTMTDSAGHGVEIYPSDHAIEYRG